MIYDDGDDGDDDYNVNGVVDDDGDGVDGV